MIFKDVMDILKNELSKVFKIEGFKYNSGKGGAIFSKVTRFGAIRLSYGVTNYDPKFIASDLVFAIRFNQVEDICSKFASAIDPTTMPENTSTTSGSLGTLTNQKHFDFGPMFTSDDVVVVANKMIAGYISIIKPQIERHTDLCGLEMDYNALVYQRTSYWRGRIAMRGIILARLCDSPRYKDLKTIYRKKCLTQDDPEIMAAYDNLVFYLDNEYVAS